MIRFGLLKWFTSERIKSAVGRSYKVVRLVEDSLRVVLASASMNEASKRQLNTILIGVVALRTFLFALTTIFGVTEAIHQSSLEELLTASKGLEELTAEISK